MNRRSACLAFAGVAGLAVLAACKPQLPVDPDPAGIKFLQVTGDWPYTASNIHLAGSSGPAPCAITGVRVSLTQIERAGAFSGRSTGGTMTCTGPLAFLSGPLIDYPIDNGYTFNQYVAFDLGAPDWRHDGLVMTSDSIVVDSMSGSFTLMNGGVEFQGEFRAVRYHAP